MIALFPQMVARKPNLTWISSNATPLAATATNVVAAPATGNHIRVHVVAFSNGGSTASWVGVRDGASGVVHSNVYLTQGGTVAFDLGGLDLSSATRLDLVLSAAGSVHYELGYEVVGD